MKRIVPVVPEQAIVAGLAVDNIVVAAPPERVAESGSGNPFNSGERVALGMAAAAGTGLQVDQDWSVGSAIIGEVEACAAVDQVAAAASGNDVVAGAASQDVVAGAADKDIFGGTARQGIGAAEA